MVDYTPWWQSLCDKLYNLVKYAFYILILAIIIVPVYNNIDVIISFIKYTLEFRKKNKITKITEEKIDIENNLNKVNPYEIRAIIGIDVGSTTSGYNMIIEPFDDSNDFEKNELIESQIMINKLSKDGLFIGLDAYSNFKGDPHNKINLYFTSFKRNLDPKINRNLAVSDYPGDEFEIEVVIREFLRKLKQKVEESNAFVDKANLTDIKWIITVPPLWDIKGKKIMELAAKKAGMVNLEVVLEPEAASLAIFSEDNKKIKKFIQPGMKFLIVDAGGYTVDFSANKILQNNTLEQLMIPVSKVNGSSLLNDKIFNLIKKYVGEEKVNKTEYLYIKEILIEIEKKKKEVNLITKEEDDPASLAIDIRYFNLSCEKGGYFYKPINECEEKIIDGIKLFVEDNKLFIPKEAVYNMILEVSKTIINDVNFILSKVGYVDLIVFTGGFSNNVIFKKCIEQYQQGNYAEVAFMKEPQSSVMKGAALFGLKPTQIIRRIVPITIWIESYEKKEEKEGDKNDNEYTDEKNEIRCKKNIKYIQKRESIETNTIIEHKIHPLNERIIIYYNYESEITDENKKELGYIDTPLSDIPLEERSLKIQMKFSNYVNVAIIDENQNQENSILLSYPKNKFSDIY